MPIRKNRGTRRKGKAKVVRQAVVVVPQARPRQAPRKRNRPKRRNGGRNEGEWRPYHLYGLKGNDKGYLTFGPSGDTPSLGGGVLKAYSEYKITGLRLQWRSQASSTSAGSMAYQIGLGNTLKDVDNRASSFKLTNSGQKTFTARDIGGDGRMYRTKSGTDPGEDQFRLAYNGNGSADPAGDLLVFFKTSLRMPK